MHIILVSNHLTTAKTIEIKWWHIAGAFFGVALLLTVAFSAMSYLGLRHAVEQRLPFIRHLVLAVNAEENGRNQAYVQENINSMALRLGQMQAQLLRLDALSEHLAAVSGVQPQELKAIQAKSDGRGGPLVSPSSLTMDDLKQSIDALAQKVEARSDAMFLIEAELLDAHLKKSMLPTSLPISAPWSASSYGWRIDPFTGERAMHEGVDFAANVGDAIYAAAAGVVVTAELHPQYGNLVEIDHGNGLSTRYAHASKLLVKPGALVKRGDKIALVGATGRATGPHLHFEVRVNGIAQNPVKFLESAGRHSASPALAQKSGNRHGRGKHYRASARENAEQGA